jgi:hypothetical protein
LCVVRVLAELGKFLALCLVPWKAIISLSKYLYTPISKSFPNVCKFGCMCVSVRFKNTGSHRLPIAPIVFSIKEYKVPKRYRVYVVCASLFGSRIRAATGSRYLPQCYLCLCSKDTGSHRLPRSFIIKGASGVVALMRKLLGNF